MSITGESQPQTGGAPSVPADAVNRQSNAAMPSGDTGAVVSPTGDGEGAGTPDLSALSGLDLQNPEVVKFLRDKDYFTRDDFNKATSRQRAAAYQAQQQASQLQDQAELTRMRADFLEAQLSEAMGEEEAKNLVARWQQDSEQHRQAMQQERESLANSWVQQAQSQAQGRILQASAGPDGETLFEVNDPEIGHALSNYLAAVRAAGVAQTPQAQQVQDEWSNYLFGKIVQKREEGLRKRWETQNGAQQPGTPEQAPQMPNQGRGRQVTAPGGAGGGQLNFNDLYHQNIESGMEPQQAYAEAWVQTRKAAAS